MLILTDYMLIANDQELLVNSSNHNINWSIYLYYTRRKKAS